jgi:fructokinase
MQITNRLRIGIDLGGSKIEVLALDQQGEELFRKRVATPKGDYPATLKAIADLVAITENKLKQKCSVGICTPGSLSPNSDLLRNSNSICLNQQPFKQDIENLLAREIRISNDANCFALSEATDGAARHAQIVFGVIIGTGCGGGIVIHQQIVEGANSIAGEWGHNPLPWPNENEINSTQCWCGLNDCLETYLSGSGLEMDYYRNCELKLDAKQIIREAEHGNACAIETISRYEERLAKSLAVIINILDPHAIVLGGGMSNVARLYENIPRLWDKYIFSDYIATQLLPPKFGDSSGVRGAAWLWNK